MVCSCTSLGICFRVTSCGGNSCFSTVTKPIATINNSCRCSRCGGWAWNRTISDWAVSGISCGKPPIFGLCSYTSSAGKGSSRTRLSVDLGKL